MGQMQAKLGVSIKCKTSQKYGTIKMIMKMHKRRVKVSARARMNTTANECENENEYECEWRKRQLIQKSPSCWPTGANS